MDNTNNIGSTGTAEPGLTYFIRTVGYFPDLVAAVSQALEAYSGHSMENGEAAETLLNCYLVAEFYRGTADQCEGTELEIAHVFDGYPAPKCGSKFDLRPEFSGTDVVPVPGFFMEEDGYLFPMEGLIGL